MRLPLQPNCQPLSAAFADEEGEIRAELESLLKTETCRLGLKDGRVRLLQNRLKSIKALERRVLCGPGAASKSPSPNQEASVIGDQDGTNMKFRFWQQLPTWVNIRLGTFLGLSLLHHFGPLL